MRKYEKVIECQSKYEKVCESKYLSAKVPESNRKLLDVTFREPGSLDLGGTIEITKLRDGDNPSYI